MKSFYKLAATPDVGLDSDITIVVGLGSDITDIIHAAIKLSADKKSPRGDAPSIIFVFNDVKVTVTADSNPELIYRDWSRARNDYIKKSVGPNPNPVLTDEEKANDDGIAAENERQ